MSGAMSAFGTKRTWIGALHMSAFGAKADIPMITKSGKPPNVIEIRARDWRDI